MPATSVLIELDSVHSQLLQRAMTLGCMPWLSSRLASGRSATLEYEIPLQVAAWLSLQSGLSAADHQIVGYDNLKQGSYLSQRGFAPAQAVPKYWDHLSAMGKRVLVINNAIGTAAGRELNGIHVCGFSTHISGEYESISTRPDHYAAELSARFPDDLYHPNDWGSMRHLDPPRLLNSVCANLERKGRVYCEFIDSEHWDHVHVGLDDLHGMAHMLVGSAANDIPLAAGPSASTNSDLILTACTALDKTLAAIAGAAGSHANLLLAALAGIGTENTWSHQLDPLLARFEHGPEPRQRSFYDRIGGTWNKLSHGYKRLLLPLKSYLRERYYVPRRRTARAFACPINEENGAIRVNLKGREPLGRVQPGAQYEDLCRELAEALRELRDVESGLPLIDELVHVPSRLGIDPLSISRVPDLIVVWSRRKTINRVESARLGQLERAFRPSRLGDHVVDGLLVTLGPAWGTSRSSERVSVLDIAPTIAQLQGLGVPEAYPGRSLLACDSQTQVVAAAAGLSI